MNVSFCKTGVRKYSPQQQLLGKNGSAKVGHERRETNPSESMTNTPVCLCTFKIQNAFCHLKRLCTSFLPTAVVRLFPGM